jgi:hypothetical protein
MVDALTSVIKNHDHDRLCATNGPDSRQMKMGTFGRKGQLLIRDAFIHYSVTIRRVQCQAVHSLMTARIGQKSVITNNHEHDHAHSRITIVMRGGMKYPSSRIRTNDVFS